ncbi:MAG: asparagine synthase-related protein [Nitrospirota bacterium]
MAKAIALLSGGLDSTLAVLLLKKQDIEVTALTFLTHFGCDMSDSSSCSSDASSTAAKYGFTVKVSHLADKFVEIVKAPKFGRGRNMNPCIDCRILMLREAKAFMVMTGSDFVVTGEVLGQRPMSQRHDTFPLIDRETGLEGLVLRPLSAKLLKPTIPETTGLVNREMLCGFSSRSRKPQMALAREFGLTDYPTPAGGCLLTDPGYAHRLKELLRHNADPSVRELLLLRVGRHFRLASGRKVIVGRNAEENEKLLDFPEKNDYLLDVFGFGSPLALMEGETCRDDLLQAAALCARYSDARHLPVVDVHAMRDGESFTLSVAPAGEKAVDSLRIQKAA